MSNTLYDLIPSQLNIYYLVKFSFHKQIVSIPTSFALNRTINFDLLEKALNIEIQRNDSLRLRFKTVDKQIKQYFIPACTVSSIPVLTFQTKEEQTRFFEADAEKPIHFLKGETYRIFFYNAYNGYRGLYFNCTHLIMDASAITIFFHDLFEVYKALEEHTELPAPLYRYEDYVTKEHERMKNTERLKKGEEFYKQYFAQGEPIYVGVHGSKFLEDYRKKHHNPDLHVTDAYYPKYDKAKAVQMDINPELAKGIYDFCMANSIAPETLFSLAMRMYCSAVNYREPDVFINIMCNKRLNYKDNRTGGCMAQTMQIRQVLNENLTFMQALEEFTALRTKIFRHINYPFVYARAMLCQMYQHKPAQGVASFMFSWLPMPIDLEKSGDLKIDFQTYTTGRYFNPLYAICYPNCQTGGITMQYIYRCKIVSLQNLGKMHANVVNIIERAIQNPDITLAEFYDGIEKQQ